MKRQAWKNGKTKRDRVCRTDTVKEIAVQVQLQRSEKCSFIYFTTCGLMSIYEKTMRPGKELPEVRAEAHREV